MHGGLYAPVLQMPKMWDDKVEFEVLSQKSRFLLYYEITEGSEIVLFVLNF